MRSFNKISHELKYMHGIIIHYEKKTLIREKIKSYLFKNEREKKD